MSREKNIQNKKKRKKSNRSRIVFFLIFLIIAAAVSVGYFKFSKPAIKSAQVHVKITGTDKVILDYPITVSGVKLTAASAFEKACVQKDISYSYKNGMFDGFDNIFSTPTDGWLFYKNDTLSEVGAGDCEIVENDFIEFKFENYAAAYNLPAQPQSNDENTIPVKVKISDGDTILLEGTVMLSDENSTALDAFKNICDKQGAVYTIEDGTVTGFKNIVNTENEKWRFYLNGTNLSEEIDRKTINSGDLIEFRFEQSE